MSVVPMSSRPHRAHARSLLLADRTVDHPRCTADASSHMCRCAHHPEGGSRARKRSAHKELDAPSSVAEFDLVQAKLESETKDTDAGKMEGGCLREFTRFLEKEVRASY